MVALGGGSATLGVGTGRVGGRAGVLVTGGTGDMARGVMVGLGIQLVKMLWSFEIAVSCLWWMKAGGVLDCTGEEVEGVDDAVAFTNCGFS